MRDFSYTRWAWLLAHMKGEHVAQIAAREGTTYREVHDAIRALTPTPRGRELFRARRAYAHHRQGARKRGVAWEFTFETWWDVWRLSGKWPQRGRGTDQYVMARRGDLGPYARFNVRICTPGENLCEAHAKLDEQTVREILASPETSWELHLRYRVSPSCISDVRCGKSWRHVARPDVTRP